MKKKHEEGLVAHKRDYSIEIKYSEEARKKKLIKFTAKRKNREFVMSLEEFINMVMVHLNKEEAHMLNINRESITMVKVERSISGKASKAFVEGEDISFNYIDTVPIEMAVAMEALNLCRIQGEPEKLPTSFIEEAKNSITEKQKEYFKMAYPKHFNKEEAPPETEDKKTLEDLVNETHPEGETNEQ